MAGELGPEELHELLGAYALDAVDPDEREQIERHLESNPRARAEVAAFRETAALLAHAGADAPAGLWDRIAGAMEEEPPRLAMPPGAVKRLVPRRPRSISLRIVAAAAAAAAAVTALLGVQLVRENRRIDRLDRALARGDLAGAAHRAAGAEGSRTVTLTSADGRERVRVVYLRDGTGYLDGSALPALPAERTYQLWALLGDAKSPTVISAGVLGRDPGVVAFRFPGPVFGFVVTDERAPGVVSSRQPALVQGPFPAT